MNTVLHLFSGLGGGALGFQRAGFRSVGAFDIEPDACLDLEYLTGEKATVADLSTMSPGDLREACTGRPDVVFTSPPCKAFSGCLPEATSVTPRYLEMSGLALRGIWLAIEAWRKRPPALFIMENVPRILSRGRRWLDQLTGLLQGYGYAVRETTHDCGELGGLAQRRRRFLLVARHVDTVPELLYEPPKKKLRSIGEVLGVLPVPLPGGSAGGAMHLLPRLSALNWVRLALIPPGGDWRDLPEAVALASREARHNGGFGVEWWEDHPSHAVLAEGSVRNTRSSVADPRVTCERRGGSMGVTSWDDVSTTVIAHGIVQNGPWQVADPRVDCAPRSGVYGVACGDEESGAVTGSARPDNGRWSYADPRLEHTPRRGSMRVEEWASPSHAVIGDARANKGASVADPRVAVVAGATIDIDSRRPTRLVIRAADGTWHRPMTTLELAVLQGFPAKHGDGWLKLEGRSHGAWRQRIGNAVPPPAAEAIARACAATLAASRDGSLLMSSTSVWVDRAICQEP